LGLRITDMASRTDELIDRRSREAKKHLLDRLPCDLLIVKPPQVSARVSRERRGAQVLAVLPAC
jgi:hypothetical protein